MPDIEKRLEAFVRLAHGIVVFPGGAGTAEEILYLLGVLLDPANARAAAAGGAHRAAQGSAAWFEQMARVHRAARWAPAALARLSVIIGDPAAVARHMVRGLRGGARFRRARSDSYNFNWLLRRAAGRSSSPFEVTHESMRALDLHRDQPVHELAANLRRAFSGIVAGNVKEQGIAAIERHGPFELQRRCRRSCGCSTGCWPPSCAQRRMKLPGSVYRPCYRLVA